MKRSTFLKSLLALPFLARIAKDEPSKDMYKELAEKPVKLYKFPRHGVNSWEVHDRSIEGLPGYGDTYEFITFNLGAGDLDLKHHTLGEFTKLLS